MIDNETRSLVKTATFRVLIIITTFVTTWLLVGELEQTTKITIVFNIFATVVYYFHERVWEKITWGRVNKTV